MAEVRKAPGIGAETVPDGAPLSAAPPEEAATLTAAPSEPAAAEGRPSVPGYEIHEELGRGGMGVVYKARQLSLNRFVALKMILAGPYAGADQLARFRLEAEAVARLQNPGIVQIHEIGSHAGHSYLALEYVSGGTLTRRCAGQPLPPAEATRLLEALARAVHYAHQRGIVHRDLKPSNVLLTEDGRPKITDFGLAKRLEAQPETTTSGPQTQSGAILGTPAYMAPEQAGGKRGAAGPSADVYALGAILYDLLTGQPPFRADNPVDVVLKVMTEEPLPPRRFQAGCPRDLETVCLKCLRKDPAGRYASAAELADDLVRFLAGEPTRARPPARGERVRRWAWRRRWWLAGCGTVVCLLLLLVVSLALNAAALLFVSTSEREGGGPASPTRVGKGPRPARGEGVPAKYRESISRGLDYLVRAQANDGHWEAVGGQYSVGITAMAGMTLLMEGSTPADGKYADSLGKAVNWLMDGSQPNGLLGDPKDPNGAGRYMIGHGLAMLFLATVYAQEEDSDRRTRLEKILTKAVEFTRIAQTKRGAWGYVTAAAGGEFDEGACTILQLQGLRAVRNAGVIVPKNLFDMNYFRKSTTPRGGVIYSLGDGGAGERPALTAAALACMLTADDYDSDLARKWLKFCQQNIPLDTPDVRIGHDEYAHYYYAQALYILGDKGYEKLFPGSKPTEQLTWSNYRATVFDSLLSRQSDDGGWNTGPLGPVYSTICWLTVLQLDDGALQIYRR
jgi:hypothetical protein